uniref:Uncharacterized protein n=1 Tax=viral metagenome TaxID=1070528 RepID=A0A6C0AW22_9ZZZZ|tara:strand:+ start:24907 stop:25467 length:561 start_codon:yes stop_codon:yes gene_type:complete
MIIISNSELFQLLKDLSVSKNIPIEIERTIAKYLRSHRIHPKLQKDIVEFVPRFRKMMARRGPGPSGLHYNILKVFYNLPHKYRKSFIISLERDIVYPNQKALIFIRKRWKDIVSYIGNKNTHIHQEASDFIIRYYAETGLDVPTKVHFRDVIWTINDYFNDLDDQDAVWAKHYKLGMARVWTRVG